MSVQHARSFIWAFSLNKQSDMATPVANAQLNKMRSMRSMSAATENQLRISDRQWFGKGHSWATFSDRIQKSYVFPAAERSATDLETLYAAAFVMGDLTTSQPDTAGSPNKYQHVIKWQSLITNKDVLYTSLGEELGSESKKKLSGAWISQFTLTGDRNDHVRLSYEGGGRKYVDGTYDRPSFTTASFFKTLYGTLRFGAADSLGDISAQILAWNITVSQNPDPYYLMGNTVNEEMMLSRVLIGDQTVSGSFTLFINATERQRYFDDTTCELEINCVSPDTVDGTRKSLKIQVHNLKISSESIQPDGQTMALTLNFNEDSVLKLGSDEHLTLTMITDIDDSEILVAA